MPQAKPNEISRNGMSDRNGIRFVLCAMLQGFMVWCWGRCQYKVEQRTIVRHAAVVGRRECRCVPTSRDLKNAVLHQFSRSPDRRGQSLNKFSIPYGL